MKSTRTMVDELEEAVDLNPDQVTDWEFGFVESMVRLRDSGIGLTSLSEKQIDSLLRIYNKVMV